MDSKEKADLVKIATISILGIAALLLFVFWLKSYKLVNFNTYTFYFRNINGLEEGAALRWNGLKIGVVETVSPVLEDIKQDRVPCKQLIRLGRRHLSEAQTFLESTEVGDLVLARERINRAQLEIALGEASKLQTRIRGGEYVRVDVVVTLPEVPIGSLNRVSIVPSGLIGEQYVDISTIDISGSEAEIEKIAQGKPLFVVDEPTRLDDLIRANVESAESIRDLAHRVNALFSDEDAEAVSNLLQSAGEITADPEFKENLKESVERINNFKLWNLLF